MKHLYIFLIILLSAPAFAQTTNYFSVKFPDDKTIIGCSATAPIDAPTITQYSCNINVGVSRTDLVFNSNESGSCYKIFRTWRLAYWCDYNPNLQPTLIENPINSDIGPTALGTPANHGYLEYTQVIKVRDDVAPVFVNCPTGQVLMCDYTNNNTALYGNACEGPVSLSTQVTDACSGTDINLTYRLFLDLDGNGSMETYIYSGGPNAFPVEKTIDSNIVHGNIVFPANYQLPYGLHKVEWVANDNCGNEAICKTEFLVKDCKNPTIVCMNGLSVNIMQTGMITLDDSDFIQYTQDNCTPANLIQVGIRKAGTGTGFPQNSHSVTFDCSELGTQLVEVWALDANGNADFCLTYVIVQDHVNACAPTASLGGTVLKMDGQPMQDVQITVLKDGVASANSSTGADGQFGPLPLWPACYQIKGQTASGTDLSTVSTWDALLAGLHLEGVTMFDQPWQYAAADVNGDGWITQEDLNAIVQVAIGGASNWPGGQAWQFIATNGSLPADATQVDLPTLCINAGPLTTQQLTAVPKGALAPASGNKATNTLRTTPFTADDQPFEAGSTVTVTINAPTAAGMAGFQCALDYDPQFLTLSEVQPAFYGLEHVQHARFDAAHQITFGWQNALAYYPDGASMFNGKPVAQLVFQAQQAGKLSDVLRMTTDRIQNTVYTSNGRVHPTLLQFNMTPSGGKSVQLLPVSPDPLASNEMMVRYDLPAASEVRIVVLNDHGHVVADQTAAGEEGYHEVPVSLNVSRSGAYTVQLITNWGIKADRLVISRQ